LVTPTSNHQGFIGKFMRHGQHDLRESPCRLCYGISDCPGNAIVNGQGGTILPPSSCLLPVAESSAINERC
jgi:hypothetical protein